MAQNPDEQASRGFPIWAVLLGAFILFLLGWFAYTLAHNPQARLTSRPVERRSRFGSGRSERVPMPRERENPSRARTSNSHPPENINAVMTPAPQAQTAPATLVLGEILRKNGIPWEFDYAGTRWLATNIERGSARNRDFAASEGAVRGHRIYRNRKNPKDGPQALYLRVHDDANREMMVRYQAISPH